MVDERKIEPFAAVVPGQSLTKQPGTAKFEQPPKYADPEEACEAVWERLTQPRKIVELKTVLKSGVPVEALANTVIRAGFNEGLWTPDVGMLISNVVMGQIESIGKRAGVKNMKIWNPDSGEPDPIMQTLGQGQEIDASSGTEVSAETPTEAPAAVGMGGLLGALKGGASEPQMPVGEE